MNRKKYITLTLMLSLLFINKTYAACTQEEINEFKKIEDEFKVTYEFDINTKDYKVTFNNMYHEKYGYLIDINMPLNKPSGGEKSETYLNIPSGNYNIRIAMISKTCTDTLKTINLKLPGYNKFSEDALCEGIEEFVLCQPTYDKDIDYDTFVSRVKTYKNTKQKKENETQEKTEEKTVLDKIKYYPEENLIEFIIVLVFVLLMIITIIITTKTMKKSRRLE